MLPYQSGQHAAADAEETVAAIRAGRTRGVGKRTPPKFFIGNTVQSFCMIVKNEAIIEGLLTRNLLTGKNMGISIKHTILFLVVISFFISLPEVKGGCAGGCSVSGGGGSSTSFMGDRATNIDMSNFDEFVRDNLGSNPGATLQAKSLSQYTKLSTNSSLNQTSNGNSSQNSSTTTPVDNNPTNTTSDNRIIKLGAFGMQDSRLSTPAFSIFDNNRL